MTKEEISAVQEKIYNEGLNSVDDEVLIDFIESCDTWSYEYELEAIDYLAYRKGIRKEDFDDGDESTDVQDAYTDAVIKAYTED